MSMSPKTLGNSTLYVASATSGSVLIPGGTVGSNNLRVYNAGSAIVFLLATNSATATASVTTGVPFPPSVGPEMITVADGQYLAMVTPSTIASTMYITNCIGRMG